MGSQSVASDKSRIDLPEMPYRGRRVASMYDITKLSELTRQNLEKSFVKI